MHLGTPCTSLTRARDAPGGPPPWRSNELPWGLPNFRPCDEHKVYVGNLLARFSCHLCREAKLRKVPWSMENLRSSRLWILPPVLALKRMKGVRVAVTDFCMWFGPYRKSTSFMYWKAGLSGIEQWRCLGAKGGVCARSGKAYAQLRGQSSEGVFWTDCRALPSCPLQVHGVTFR